ILRIPYAPMVSALVGVMSLIPVVGAFIGGGVGAFMIFTESPIKALVFVIFIIVLQQFEGNLIYPKVVGSQVQLPAIWVLAAVTVGGALAGPMGILLGIPITSTAYVLIREATEKREQKLAASVTQPSEAESETPSETE
ncbi:MAG: AI-2E family transporter, partial [Clostridia bacterium]|nr:AI-2E family transporter [Clostridia bacterium]